MVLLIRLEWSGCGGYMALGGGMAAQLATVCGATGEGAAAQRDDMWRELSEAALT